MRILLVDDTLDSRLVIREMLEQLGHEVVEASNAKDALQSALHQDFGLVLMDLSMQDIDGFVATGAMRRIGSLSRIPVVAITAYSREFSETRARQAGCNDYLRKPFTLEDLSAVVRTYDDAA